MIKDGQMSFLVGTGSGTLMQLLSFAKNHRAFHTKYAGFLATILDTDHEKLTADLFSLDTFLNLMQLQVVEKVQQLLFEQWN